MKDHLFVIVSVILLAIGFILQKLYQKHAGQETIVGVTFSIYSACFSLVLLLAMNRFTPEFSWYSLINAALRAACGLAYTVIGFRIMKYGNVALYMLFLMSGGMILPAVWGWLFLHEAVIPLRVLGVMIIFVSILITQLSKERPNLKLLFFCLAVFVLNGFVSVLSKLHQINTTYHTVSTESYALIGTILSLGMSLILYACLRKKKRGAQDATPHRKRKLPVIQILIVAGYSILGCVSSLIQLRGAKFLPASVLYPMITGGSIVFSGLFALLFFGERPSKREWLGIALCVCGTLLFL